MLSNQTLWLVFHVFVVLSLLLLLACGVSAGLYDIRLARRERKNKQSQANLFMFSQLKDDWLESHRSKNSVVTILVPAYNEEAVILRCLESIFSLSYKNFRVVIVNDASKDSTARLVRQFKKENPTLPVRLVDLKLNRGKGGALNYALNRYCDTELLMVVDADCTLKKDALTRAVDYFKNPQIMGVAANIRIAEDPSLLSYLQKIEYLIGYRNKKFYSVTNSEFIIGGQGSTYRTNIVKKVGGFDETMLTEDIYLSLSVAKKGNKTHRLTYASDVITYTEAVPDIKGLFNQRYRWKFGAMQALFANKEMILSRSRNHSLMLTWMRIPQALFGEFSLLLEPLILSVFILVAIITHSPIAFLGSWFTLTAYAIFVIMVDEYLSRKDRIKLSAMSMFMYPLFYMVTLLNVIAMFKCLINWRKLFGIENTRGAWISPNRVGKRVLN